MLPLGKITTKPLSLNPGACRSLPFLVSLIVSLSVTKPKWWSSKLKLTTTLSIAVLGPGIALPSDIKLTDTALAVLQSSVILRLLYSFLTQIL